MEFPDTLFRTGPMILSREKTLRNVPSRIAFEFWDAWVCQALEALHWLHSNGFRHGCLDAGSFRIDDKNQLRIVIRPGTGVPASDPFEQEPFDPQNKVYPPEHLMRIGRDEGYSFSTLFDFIESNNYAYDFIPSQFINLAYTKRSYETVFRVLDIVDSRNGDSWMLANIFLDAYLEHLTWPEVFSTTFYRTEHEQFMGVLERLLCVHPSQRFTAMEALRVWNPGYARGVHYEPEIYRKPKLTESSEIPSLPSVPSLTSEISEVPCVSSETSDVVSDVPSSDPPTVHQKRPRLVLNGPHDPSVRNKTRRNLRSLNRNSANDNPSQQTQG